MNTVTPKTISPAGTTEASPSRPGSPSSEKKPPGAGAAAPSPPAARPVIFRLFAPLAKSVHLAGTFNDWNPHNYPLKAAPHGEWSLQLHLRPGRYEYRFLVDGRWQPDPLASQKVAYRFAEESSVLVVSYG